MPVYELRPPASTSSATAGPLSPRKHATNISTRCDAVDSARGQEPIRPGKLVNKMNTTSTLDRDMAGPSIPPELDEPDSDEVVVVESSPAYDNASAPPSPARFEDDVSMEVQQDELAGTDAGREVRGATEPMSNPEAAALEDPDLAVLHVEVRLRPTSTIRLDLLKRQLRSWLHNEFDTILTNAELEHWDEVEMFERNVDRVWIGECPLPEVAVELSKVTLEIHAYQPPSTSKIHEFSAGSGDGDDDDEADNDVPAASVLQLPSRSLEGLWDTLVYEGDVKSSLLSYIYSTVLFSDAMVDFNIVTWNRVVLLHGPPGTGKTSLCRALAQKLSIRLSERYHHGKLVEINSHSLFSKWFSESGKLVQRLFSSVTEMVDDESCFVVVLIDEVESLTAARAGAMSGKEPSDALRVVNALLTQLDKLKNRKNVLVMTTSNLSGAIDGAFIDRADIKQYIGLPPPQAVYWILQSCINEIMRAGLVQQVTLLDWKTVDVLRSTGETHSGQSEACSFKLYDLATACHGMSGRTLRRLPVLAHAKHIRTHSRRAQPLQDWLEAMRKCVEEEGEQLRKIEEGA